MVMQNPFTQDYLSDWDKAFSFLYGDQLRKNNPFAQWLQGRSGDWRQLFQGDIARENDPNLTPLQYLQRFNPQSEWAALTPRQRGEQPSPLVRYLGLFGDRR